MPVTVTCGCGNPLHVSDHLMGKSVGCPSCGAILDVPASRSPEPAPKAAPAAEESVRYQHPGPPAPAPDPALSWGHFVLRSLALALGIVGGLGAGTVGVFLYSDLVRPYSQEIVKDAEASLAGDPRAREYLSPEKARQTLAEHYRDLTVAGLLVAAGLLGPVGGLLAFWRWRWSAAGVLVATAVAPVPLLPRIVILTLPLLFSAALALLVRPTRKMRPGMKRKGPTRVLR